VKPVSGTPFLKLSFYYADMPEQAALGRLITVLSDLGAELVGKQAAHTGPNAGKRFRFPSDYLQEFVEFELSELSEIIANPDIRLVPDHYDNWG
jgi:hypothetical protein